MTLARQAGIDVLSDGEYRRHDWAGDFTAAVEGYVSAQPPIRFDWKLPASKVAGESSMRAAVLEAAASGGVSSLDDLRAVAGLGTVEGAIVGKALYAGAFTLPEALAAVRR